MASQPSAITCKTCGTQFRWKPQLAGRTVRCKCGAPLSVPTAVSGVAAMYADRIPHRYSPPDEPAGPSKITIGVGVLMVIAIAVVGMWFLRHTGSEHAGALAGDDASIIDTMNHYRAVEARQWMAVDSGRMVMGMTTEQGKRFIDKMYDMGAVRVMAWGGYMTTVLAVELPADQQKRKAIFDWHRQWQRGSFQPSPGDVGQRYIIVNLKP